MFGVFRRIAEWWELRRVSTLAGKRAIKLYVETFDIMEIKRIFLRTYARVARGALDDVVKDTSLRG